MPNKEMPAQILAAIQHAIGPANELVLLHRPFIPKNAWSYVKDCLDTGWVSSAGSYVTKFEETLAQIVGCKRAVAVVNGTAALEICLRLAGVETNDEVICPALTFVATANAIAHCSAVPHFVDVSPDRLSICPAALAQRLEKIAVAAAHGSAPINRETGRRIAAVCVMHCFGHPADLQAIGEICDRFGIPLVEDAAESLGSLYRGTHTGRFGRLAAVSFNGNKILTTGGGGAIITDDEQLADRAKHLTTTAKVAHPWEFYHDEIGWNYRMPNMNAALGLAQLEVLPDLLKAKRKLAETYAIAFERIVGVRFLTEPEGCQSNYWLNGLILDDSNLELRDSVLETLNRNHYQCRPLWQPMHQLPPFSDAPRGELPNTEWLYGSVINIPSSADLSADWGSRE